MFRYLLREINSMAEKRIFLAGHSGMVGSAIWRKLKNDDNNVVITASRDELNLLDQTSVSRFFMKNKIDQVYLAAAKVGGIHANNTYPAEFIYQNLMIEANIIHEAHQNDVQQILFLGSSCIYPKMAAQPISENALMTGMLEETNEPYAIAKIAGIKLCESYNRQYGRDYRSVMPTNLFGPGDNFHPNNSHVVPALIRRFHEGRANSSKVVEIWGSGTPLREFLYVDDMASACLFVLGLESAAYAANTQPMVSHVNVGSGQEINIRDLAELIAEVVGYNGQIVFDKTMPDGSPRKLMDSSVLKAMGWTAKTSLQEGMIETVRWFMDNQKIFRN